MTVAQKARLTTWLISQRLQGNPQPTITEPVIKAVKDKPSLPVHERAERLLRYIAQHIGTVGQTLILGPEDLAAYAWSESTEWHEIVYCFAYLLQVGLARGRIGGDSLYDCEVSVDGYRHIAEQAGNVDSSQAFVAMWFGDSIANAYEDGIEAGIRDAGFSPSELTGRTISIKSKTKSLLKFAAQDLWSQILVKATTGPEAGYITRPDSPMGLTCR